MSIFWCQNTAFRLCKDGGHVLGHLIRAILTRSPAGGATATPVTQPTIELTGVRQLKRCAEKLRSDPEQGSGAQGAYQSGRFRTGAR